MSTLTQRLSQLSPERLALAAQGVRGNLAVVRAEPIAIVGMSCRFPGGADTPERFWQVLADGVDTITDVPAERWDVDAYYDPDPDSVDRMYTRSGSFIGPVDQFDAAFFNISPREAALMDPQQRLLLEVSWEALERAGLSPQRLRGTATGVFVGAMTQDYSRLLEGSNLLNAYAATGNGFSFMAGRVAHFLGLHGPTLAVDTACSSSLVSVHLACQSLRLTECQVAIAGGVNLSLSPDSTIIQCRTRMLSPGGRCRTFDAAADGYVKGEGCGVVVLKRLCDALADGDSVLAVIRGSALNHDGPSSGITVPNGRAQVQVIRGALEAAGVEPDQVTYVEAHGTGTPLGDPIEIESLGHVFGGRDRTDPLFVGSVKTNLGHLEGAAGIVGLIKVVLALQHQQIPAHLHYAQPNPNIRWSELPISVTSSPVAWPAGTSRRIAGVSAFSFSGTNCHVVLEEAPVAATAERGLDAGTPDWHLLTLSALSEAALRELAKRYATCFAESETTMELRDACSTANTGRAQWRHRLAVVACSVDQARQRLAAAQNGQTADGMFAGRTRGAPPRAAFVFDGREDQSDDAMRVVHNLNCSLPAFRAALDRCADALRPYLDGPLLEVRDPRLAGFALQYGLAMTWRAWGIAPNVVVGHDLGEYAAACTAGVYTLEDAAYLVARRAGLAPGQPSREVRRQRPHVPFIEAPRAPADGGYGCDTLLDIGAQCADRHSMLEVLADLYVRGAGVDWTAVDSTPARRVLLPTYPFERQRHWFEPVAASPRPVNTYPAAPHSLLGARLSLAGTHEVRFESELSPDRLNYLQDHHVYGAAVMPAAAFLEMAFAAGESVLRTDQLVLEDVTWQRALLLADAVTLQCVLTPVSDRQYTCRIFSRRRDEPDAAWILHASAEVSFADDPGDRSDCPGLDVVRRETLEGVAVTAHYARLEQIGLEYGPQFRLLDDLQRGDNVALGHACVPHESADRSRAIHPALLDAAFQTWAAVTASGGTIDEAVVPVGVKHVRLYGRAGREIWAEARFDVDDAGGPGRATLRVRDANGSVVLSLEDFQARSVNRETLLRGARPPLADCLYELAWEPHDSGVAQLPAPEALQTRLAGSIDALRDNPALDLHTRVVPPLEDLSLHYVVAGLRDLGWNYSPGDRMSLDVVAADLNVTSTYRPLLGRLLHMLGEVGMLQSVGRDWLVCSDLPARQSPPHAAAEVQLTLLERCCAHLADVLRGRCDPLELLFPGGDGSLAGRVYRDSPGLAALNGLLASGLSSVSTLTSAHPRLRVLEVGAGTGSTTEALLEHVPADRIEYTFTDISPLFVNEARARFATRSSMHYAVLDLERSPAEQGFESHAYDVVIAANVLHATREIRESLRNVRTLLAPDGLLLLLEGTAPLRWLDLTFGLLPGWWRFAGHDDLRPDYPLLSLERWQTVLRETGFRAPLPLTPPPDAHELFAQQAVVVAQVKPEDRHWLLVSSRPGGLSAALRERLTADGATCAVADADLLEPTSVRDSIAAATLDAPVTDVVYLADISDDETLDATPALAERITAGGLHLAQALLRTGIEPAPNLWFVTRGAVAEDATAGVSAVASSPLWGLGRSLFLECPELRCRLVDLDPARQVDDEDALVAELSAPTLENQVLLRGSGRRIARLVRRDASGSAATADGRLRTDGTYLITGGLGGLGLAVAQWLVQRGARDLVLLGRNGLQPSAQGALRELESAGAHVRVVAANVAEVSRMSDVLTDLRHHSPPLRGVVHAAGVLDDGILLQQTWQRFERVFESKVAGAWNLHQLTVDLGLDLDFFVLFSSASSILGRPGQTSHAAANAFLDTLAHYRRRRGLPALSINWGAWSDVGSVATVDSLERSLPGVGSITASEGIRALEQLLQSSAVQVAVLPMDWPTFASRLPPEAHLPLVSALGQRASQSHAPPRAALRQHDLLQQLRTASDEASLRLVVDYLQRRLTETLGFGAPEQVDPRRPLPELGLDSLMGIELKNRLSDELGVDVPLVEFIEADSLLDVAEQIRARVGLTQAALVPADQLEVVRL